MGTQIYRFRRMRQNLKVYFYLRKKDKCFHFSDFLRINSNGRILEIFYLTYDNACQY